MSEADYIDWELLFSPAKKKRKKKFRPSSVKMLTQKPKEDTPKKKKNKKFKKAMMDRKEKRKKKKKDKLCNLQDIISDDCVDETEQTACLTSENTTEKNRKKRKKHVTFDLSHNYKRVKRPAYSSSLPQPTNFFLPISAGTEDTATVEQCHIQAKTNDSQSTNDDIQSQDLFITQKTFTLPLSEMSSEETSDRTEDNAKVMGIYFRETQEECILFKTHKIEKSGLCQQKRKANLFLEEPIVVTSSPVGEKIPEDCPVNNQFSHPGRQQKSLMNASTQTENFFTTELSLYLNFCKKSTSKTRSDELAPLDLSLPHRARRGMSTSTTVRDGETNEKDNLTVVSSEGSGQVSLCGGGKEERTLSPQSESDNKSAETTVSSEDAEVSSHTTRLELMQVRAVQMRLNESFFFKTKGEKPSPRAESPLMKLVQGREPCRTIHKKN